eukprot:GEMP01058104.1.p1 GENE.GEMP01058104.1~~GEMP01058104.1.p1  ORF type:complete len:206 (+),score=26.57 GEMP01058104.1:55-672(+)
MYPGAAVRAVASFNRFTASARRAFAVHVFKETSPLIHENSFVAKSSDVIGNVTIGEDASVWYQTVLRGDVAPIVIGNGTNIQDGTVIHVRSAALGGEAFPTTVGEYCTVGHMALLHACTLHSYSFVGMQSALLDGSVVESEAMLAAGSLLLTNQVVPKHQLWGGRPAKFLRNLTEKEIELIHKSAAQYIALSREHSGQYIRGKSS